jgi:hypothetical protein
MKLQLVAPRQGLVWVQRAFQVFARQPLGFAALFATCLFVFLLLGLIPLVGTIALLVLPPAGSLLFMIASRRVTEGGTAMPGSIAELASSGRSRLLALLKLGIVYAAATFILFWLAGVLDGGTLESFLASLPDAKTTPESAAVRIADSRLQLGLVLRLAFAGALSIPFWHAPALVHWGGQGWASRSSSAASRSGATRAPSACTGSPGSPSGCCFSPSSASASACSGRSASPSSRRR